LPKDQQQHAGAFEIPGNCPWHIPTWLLIVISVFSRYFEKEMAILLYFQVFNHSQSTFVHKHNIAFEQHHINSFVHYS